MAASGAAGGETEWIRSALVGLGVAVLLMLLATHYIGHRHVFHYAPLARATADLRVAVATSHLWLEEHLAGDRRVDLQRDVWAEMDRADTVVAAMLEGGRVDRGHRLIEPLTEEHLRRRVEAISRELAIFRDLAGTRVEEADSSGIGSRRDQAYDRVFRRLLAEATDLERAVEQEMAVGRQRSLLLLALIVFVWLLMIGVALATLARRRRSQRRAEAALAESEAQLMQAQKLEAVGRLAGGLAHDVNNYLATVNVQCGLVKVLHADQPSVVRMMDEVIATVGRTSGLIRRLLAFSRSRPSRPEVVDLRHLTRDLASMLRRLLSDHLQLELDLGEEPSRVVVDPSQVEQVLVNLLVNAREAMPDGGPVTVCIANVLLGDEALTGAGEYVLLAVEDQGVGMPPAVQDKIFEPFFSTKRPLDTAAGGAGEEPASPGGGAGGQHSGLGLATVYAIVQDAGGFVTVDSEEGVGTRFSIFLPRTHRPEAEEERARPRRAATDDEPATAGAPLRVLVVEDDAALRHAADAILTAIGLRVECSPDGAGAVERLEATAVEGGPAPFDVVVTDLVMPGASGRQVALAALERGCAGVVLVSGYRSRIEVEDLLEDSRVRYLDKPYDPRDLIAALTALGRSAAVEGAP